MAEAEEILERVLSCNTSLSDFKNWFVSADIKSSESSPEIQGINTSKAEFVLFFLNYLRDETYRILKVSSNQPTPSKAKQQVVSTPVTVNHDTNQRRSDAFPLAYQNLMPNPTSVAKPLQDPLSPEAKALMIKDCMNIRSQVDGNNIGRERLREERGREKDGGFREKQQSGNSSRLWTPSPPHNTRKTTTPSSSEGFISANVDEPQESSSPFQTAINRIDKTLESQHSVSSPRDKKPGSGNNRYRRKSGRNENIPSQPESQRFSATNQQDSPSVSQNFGRKICGNKLANSVAGNPPDQHRSSGSSYNVNLEDLMSRRAGQRNRRSEEGDGGNQPRRIKPTRLTLKPFEGMTNAHNPAFGTISRTEEPIAPFRNQTTLEASPQTDLSKERDLLRMERLKQPVSHVSVSSLPNLVKPVESINPDPNLVHKRDRLEILCQVYCLLIEANLVVNLASELSFLMNLLVAKDYAKSPATDKSKRVEVRSARNLKNPTKINFDSEKKKIAEGNAAETDSSSVEFTNDIAPHLNATDFIQTTFLQDSKTPEENANYFTETNITFNQTTFLRECEEIATLSLEDDVNGQKMNVTDPSLTDRESDITCRSPNDIGVQNSSKSILNSVHNCVYFSTAVLDHQRQLLDFFDRRSLKLLAENTRISTFKPALWQHLVEVVSRKFVVRVTPTGGRASTNVMFVCDTDNRQSFPTEAAFYSFKKQRDAFYDILQTWEKSHLSANWSFSQSLGSKIRNLISLGTDSSNYIHLARLFRSQLLNSCAVHVNNSEESVDGNVIASLKSIDAAKFARLSERLVTPVVSNSRSDFPGEQEFYQEFIIAANCAAFHAHLIDSLATEIQAINTANLTLTAAQLDDRESQALDSMRLDFLTCVNSLSLLAKFLGFTTFMPYRSDSKLTTDMALTHASFRCKVVPPLDVMMYLSQALERQQLVLTVPWIVKYLSMIDAVSIHLPYYSSVIDTLCWLHFNIGRDVDDNGLQLPSSTVHLIKLLVGWLFECPSFPSGLYFSWWRSQDNSNAQVKVYSGPISTQSSLDRLELVDMSTLHTLCPDLGRLKVILTSQSVSHMARHVTPASLPTKPKITEQDQTQLHLEASFFTAQPSATQRTVAFVADRVACACVKHLSAVVSNLKSRAADAQQDKEVATRSAVTQCEEEVERFCDANVTAALPALLSPDTLDEVKLMCLKIATRQSKQKAYAWVQANVTTAVFTWDPPSEDKSSRAGPKSDKTSHVVQPGSRVVQHDESASSPLEVIEALRDCVLAVRAGLDTPDSVPHAIAGVAKTITHREDLIPTSELVIHRLLVDLALAAVSNRPQIMTEELVAQLVALWQMPQLRIDVNDMAHIVSPRNLFLLTQQSCMTYGLHHVMSRQDQEQRQEQVWTALARLLLHLLLANLLTVEALSKQCAHIKTTKQAGSLRLVACVDNVITEYNTIRPSKGSEK